MASGLADEEQRFEIDAVDGVPVLLCIVLGELRAIDIRTVHQGIDAPHFPNADIYQFLGSNAPRLI